MLPHNAKIYKKNKMLTFDEKEHLYYKDNKLLNRSISSVANVSKKDILLKNLSEYGDFGTAVHETIEKWAKSEKQVNYGTEETTTIQIIQKNKTIKYTNEKRDILISNLKKLFSNSTMLLSEAPVYDVRRETPGTVDLGIEKNNKKLLIDFKTSTKLVLNNIIQLNLYKRILRVNYGINYDKLYVVKIDRETMELTVHQVTDVNDTIWESLPDDVEKRTFISDFWRENIKEEK